jgi:phage terminase large subunit GpA-like protein
MFCPGCGTILSEADRLRMIRHVRQRSTLEPEEAARRQWIGVHISQLYSPQIALRELAGYYVDALKSNNLRVFVNMRLGDKFEPQVRKIESDALRRCIVSPGREDPALKRDPHCYDCGQVPPGVRFLTLGQDSRETELHWAVWGFGMRRHADHGHPEICGWLIDRGVFERAKSPVLDASELHVFDALYWRQWPTTYDDKRFLQIRLGAHDIGWSNRRGDDNDKRNVIAVNEYCRQMFPLARPARGAALDMSSASRADLVRAGNPERYLYRGESVADERVRPLLLNTFLLKEHFFGLVAKRIPVAVCGTGAPAGAPSAVPAVPLKTQNSELITSVPPLSVREFTRITFPRDVGDRFLRELGAEELQAVGRKGELAWVRKGPNHFLDCTIMAFGAAIHENLFTDGLTFEEAEARAQVAPARTAPKGYYPGVDEE